jgi:hypothetical protein
VEQELKKSREEDASSGVGELRNIVPHHTWVQGPKITFRL